MGKGAKLILLRHGQSEWNRLNLFTGWVDIPLSKKGIEEAVQAGKKISCFPIDEIYTSSLLRAQMTAALALCEHSSGRAPCVIRPEEKPFLGWGKIHSQKTLESVIPMYAAWELNERMYGDLQGLNKQETRDQFGDEQVHIWRRSFDQAPPHGESLEQTAERSIPYFKKEILPKLVSGKNILIAAHGNSLRAIIMFLDRLSKEEVIHLEIATGEPIVYTFAQDKWHKDG